MTTYFITFKVPFILWEYFLGVSHRGSSLLTQCQTFGLNDALILMYRKFNVLNTAG